MQGLTARQQEVAEFIQRRVRRKGQAPSYRDIARHIGRDVRAAYQHVEALERKGVLERVGGGIQLLGEYRPPRGLPVLGRIAAGTPILAAENIEEHIDIEREFRGEAGEAVEDLFLLRVKGDSMTGAGIHDGDLVLVRSQETVEDGEIAAVVIGEEATVKRVRLRRNRIRLEPANRKYKPITLGPDDMARNEVRIAGKVLMAIRRL
jgi:repressor LexA